MDPVVSVQNKNFSGNTKELAKVLGAQIGRLKSFTLTILWNLAIRSETNGIAERAVRRVKEGTSAVLLQSALNENW